MLCLLTRERTEKGLITSWLRFFSSRKCGERRQLAKVVKLEHDLELNKDESNSDKNFSVRSLVLCNVICANKLRYRVLVCW